MIATPVALCAVLGVCAGSLQDPEPPAAEATREQRFFDWTRSPFPPETFVSRRAALIEHLRESGGGVFLCPSAAGRSHGETFRQLDDFWYFTGLEVPRSVLLVDAAARESILFAPLRDARFEHRFRPNDFPGRPLGADPELAKASGLHRVRSLGELRAVLESLHKEGRSMGVNLGRAGEVRQLETGLFPAWSAEEFLVHHLQASGLGTKIDNAYTAVAAIRGVKSAAEIEILRRAAAITAQGIRAAARKIRPGVDERSLEAELEATFKRMGAQRLAFASIVKSGPNSLWPWRILACHYDRRNRALRNGDLVIFDVGCEFDHYVSDVGRTFPASGRFSKEQRAKLEMITAVSDAVIAAIKPGLTFAELTRIAVEKIPPEERGYMNAALFYGHHLGLSVSDPILPAAPLRPGMVFTVEPWYYNHDRELAVFVEDEVLVTRDGCENLTASLPRKVDELEKMVGEDR